jgi:1-aminocyclopropane-1-carboxylate deaminase/D-cysteine desulfhydrase-like pyridoxal-dependent ACC family enzyme
MQLYRQHTPIEKYTIGGKVINVKRDDLFARPPAPPLGKLRGVRALLKGLAKSDGRTVVGCFQTRLSDIGHALAAACLEFPSLKCVVVYPRSKSNPIPNSVESARRLGAEAIPIRANVLPICYSQSARILADLGGVMLPFGMECEQAVDAVAKEAARIPVSFYSHGSVIVPCGSGVTLAGVLRGLHGNAGTVIGVSCGRSVAKIESCVKAYEPPSSYVRLISPIVSHYEAATVHCPFPCHPHYDLKAWAYTLDNIRELKEPIFFWNVGG